jgi:chloramphenicol O-acetyltransferase
MRHPIIYDEKNKTFYVLTSVFSEQYEDFTRSSIREIHITSKKIVIVLKDKSIVLSKYIENRDKLISFLKGESK